MTDVELARCLQRLAQCDDGDWRAVEWAVRRGTVGGAPELAEDAVQEVLLKLLERARDGTLPAMHRPGAYLAQMGRNALRDARRRALRHARELPEPVAASAATVAEASTLDLGAVLQAVFDHALQARAPQGRPGLVEAWEILLAVLHQPEDLRGVVERRRGGELSGEALKREMDRVYQGQRRLRLALGEAVAALEGLGRLDAEEAGLARDAIGRLAWCQKSARRTVPGEE